MNIVLTTKQVNYLSDAKFGQKSTHATFKRFKLAPYESQNNFILLALPVMPVYLTGHGVLFVF